MKWSEDKRPLASLLPRFSVLYIIHIHNKVILSSCVTQGFIYIIMNLHHLTSIIRNASIQFLVFSREQVGNTISITTVINNTTNLIFTITNTFSFMFLLLYIPSSVILWHFCWCRDDGVNDFYRRVKCWLSSPSFTFLCCPFYFWVLCLWHRIT